MTKPRPDEYKDNWGELVRAYRTYLGLSQRTMSKKLNIAERSLSDIEIGRRQCPRGFIDSIEKIVDEYEADVQDVINGTDENQMTEFKVSAKPDREWFRSVVGRAAVEETGRILPVLEG